MRKHKVIYTLAVAAVLLVTGWGTGTQSAEAKSPKRHTQHTTFHRANDIVRQNQAARIRQRLTEALPNYNKPAPAGCYEDEFCWTGSLADSRTDAQISAQLIYLGRFDGADNCWGMVYPDAILVGCDGFQEVI